MGQFEHLIFEWVGTCLSKWCRDFSHECYVCVYMLFFSTPQELTLLIHRSNYNSLFTQTLSCDFFMIVTREISDDLGQPVNCISLSNDGNCVLAGCLDSTLRLLDRYLFFPRSYSCKFLSPKC